MMIGYAQRTQADEPASRHDTFNLLDLDLALPTTASAATTADPALVRLGLGGFDLLGHADTVSLSAPTTRPGSSLDFHQSPAIDPFASLGGVPVGRATPTAPMELTALESARLRVVFQCRRDELNPTTLLVNVLSQNLAEAPLSNYLIQVAVPKSMRLIMHPPTATALAPFGQIQQSIEISNPEKVVFMETHVLAYEV